MHFQKLLRWKENQTLKVLGQSLANYIAENEIVKKLNFVCLFKICRVKKCFR